jgi:hypothetical protein
LESSQSKKELSGYDVASKREGKVLRKNSILKVDQMFDSLIKDVIIEGSYNFRKIETNMNIYVTRYFQN